MSEIEKDYSVDELEPDIIELDGEQFEVVESLEHEGVNYFALIPYGKENEDEEYTEFIILREVEENGEYFLATIDNDEFADKIGDLFLARFDELEKMFSESGDTE